MLEIYNMELKMRSQQRIFIITIALILVLFLGYFVAIKSSFLFSKLEIVIFVFTILLAGIYFWNAFKKNKEELEGQPEEDEMSNMIKYKTGHQAYMASMYMWLFFFIFKNRFPTTESLIGGGIILSSLIYYVVKLKVKREYYGK